MTDQAQQNDAAGVDMEALNATLGHSPYASTVDTYTPVELCPGGCGRPTNDPNDDLCSSCLEDGDHLA
jgi:hypothetical protein